jgi:outer membrane receptor for ferrienterochelin and colicins
MRSLPLRSTSWVLIGLATTSAWAQSSPDKTPVTPPVQQLEGVTVRSNAERDDRRESTASKTVVTREDLARYGDTNIADVLKRLPGVTIGGTPGRGGGADIRMRGMGGGYTSIMLNGERVPPGFSLDSLSPDLIERIEVYQATTADKSAQSMAGGINIILKQQVRLPQQDVRISASSEGGRPTVGVGTQWARREGSVSWVLGGDIRHETYAQPSRAQRRSTDANGQVLSLNDTDAFTTGQVDTLVFAPRLSWKADADNDVSGELFTLLQRQTSSSAEHVSTSVGTPPTFGATTTDTSRGMSQVRARLNWTRKLADAAQLEAHLGGASGTRDQDSHYDYASAAGVPLKHSDIRSPSTDRSWTFSGKYRLPYVTGHAVSAGWDGEWSRRGERLTQVDALFDNSLSSDNADDVFSAKVARTALFAQDEWEVSPNWSLYEGLRWEAIGTRTAGAGSSEVKNNAQVLSPILQSLWKVPESKGDQVRLALSRTYKAPNTRDLSPRRYLGASDNTPTSPDSEGNPSLKPELAWGLDLAYERHLEVGGVLSASTYLRRISDVILQEVYQDGSRWVSHPVNGGHARVFGLELEAKAPLRQWVNNAPAIELRSNLSRNWSVVDDVPGPHNRLAQQAPLSANLGLEWKPVGTMLTLGGNASVTTGGQVRTSAKQTVSSSVRRQLDVFGLWKATPQAQWRLSLNNLLHQDQLASSTYAGTSSTLSQDSVVPSYTSVRLSLELKL